MTSIRRQAHRFALKVSIVSLIAVAIPGSIYLALQVHLRQSANETVAEIADRHSQPSQARDAAIHPDNRALALDYPEAADAIAGNDDLYASLRKAVAEQRTSRCLYVVDIVSDFASRDRVEAARDVCRTDLGDAVDIATEFRFNTVARETLRRECFKTMYPGQAGAFAAADAAALDEDIWYGRKDAPRSFTEVAERMSQGRLSGPDERVITDVDVLDAIAAFDLIIAHAATETTCTDVVNDALTAARSYR